LKRVRVVAALIADDRDPQRFLVQQRLADKSRANLWEFPGGKVEPGETDAEALAREAREELDVALEVNEHLWDTVHTYADLTVELVLYRSRITGGTPKALGAQAICFATAKEMKALPFCEADLPLLDVLERGI
jgi:8-oxo-dGTP diphosphatase